MMYWLASIWIGATLLLATVVSTIAQQPVERNGDEELREVLRLYEVDDSVLTYFRDGEDLSNDELEPVYRLLYLLPRFDALQRFRWRHTPEDWAAIASDPSAHRASLFEISGRVIRFDRRPLPLEAARRFGIEQMYRVEIESTIDGRTLVVCAPQVPVRWPSDPRGQPVQCDAVLLKVGQGASGGEDLIFVTDRLAWLPNEAVTEQGIDAGWAALGMHGMDVSRFQDLKQKTPLGDSDRECFYQMLWVMRRLTAADVARVARSPLPIVDLLRDAPEHVGRAYRFSGTARRAIRVRVDDADVRERFGIDHYFEIEIFTPLKQPLQLVDARDGAKRAYQNYPVTVCCPALPPGMAEGDAIRQVIEVDAFFLKLWSYRSAFAAGDGEQAETLPRRQVSPLMMARSIRLHEPTHKSNPWPAWSMAAMVIGTVGFALIARWFYARSDRPFQRWRQAQESAAEITFPDDGDLE